MSAYMINEFKKYVNGTSVKSVTRQCVGNTLSCVIITLVDIDDNIKVVVVADRGLVSFDNGFYFHINKCDEIDSFITAMISDF